MRIHIVDTLLEDHLTHSLATALRELGHEVRCTGPVWHGWRLPREGPERERVDEVVTEVLAARPDVVLAMRTATLDEGHLRRLRRHGVFTVGWFSDDPVLFAKQSRRIAPHYDRTVHAAMGPVLELYERELGVRGLGMQFWASDADFPRCYDPAACDIDLVFIGNTHTGVKRWRYDWIAALPVTRAVYGKTSEDPAGIVAGLIEDPVELARCSARGRFGLNISQRFADYEGTIFDFPGLAELGEFPLPSRVVQLASAGVPVLALVASSRAAADLAVLFPPVVVIEDAEQVADVIASHDEAALAELSGTTRAWCEQHYRPAARARFLHAVLHRPGRYRRMDADARATAFLGHPTPDQAWTRRVRRAMPLTDAVWRIRRRSRRLVSVVLARTKRVVRRSARRVRGRRR